MTDLITRKPSDWDIKNLENIATFITKGATPTTYGFEWVEESSDSIPFLRSECVTANGFNRKGMNFISKKAHVTMGRSKIKSGDILMTITGNIGRIATLPDEIPEANINQHIAKISVIDGVSSSYVAQALQQERYNRYYERILTGQAYPQISLKQVRETPILLPPHPEQQKISEVLSTVDKKIDLIDQKISETEKLKTGLMQKLFSEGFGFQDDNGNWNPHTEFKNSNFGSIPSTWEVKNLKQIGECFIGLTYKPEDTTDSSGTLVLRSSNVQNQRLCLSNNVYVKCQIPEKIQVKKGDILICVRNGSRALIGKSALIKKDMDNTTFGAFMSIFRSELSDLIYQLFQTEIYRKQIYKNLGATINQITNKNLYSFEFPIPPKEERQKIVNVLTTIDNNIDLLIKQKAETQQLKKGLMQKLLTGEWRVPVEETEAA